ncbi:hypothetical protein [Lysinibacillus fusiformis]|uniref:hypothetical protein n=1 Tax=Lysinibacillus fusiformis TaxID=28031 RepID=UPI000D377281|nr:MULTISPECIES: hypothetical protein [Lysinibacillus]MED4672101.1 hypothetical protein [Lysinibacillus fusiformis]QAS57419.1 hypothetical protein LSP_14210 [Lysinibacillus sphaericus]RDV26984.1 hypothetical protein C7B90_20000 [Lysinibacillus fusiformis]GED65135.1 hypothetical protein LFU01_35870 [Lysinibacillus fusiformis]
MNKADKEIEVLTNATVLAGTLLTADESKREAMLPKLKALETEVKATQLEVHKNLKRLVIMTVNSAIRYCSSGKPSDAKLTRRHGNEVAKELGRLKRLAHRKEENRWP